MGTFNERVADIQNVGGDRFKKSGANLERSGAIDVESLGRERGGARDVVIGGDGKCGFERFASGRIGRAETAVVARNTDCRSRDRR
ncbi:hypothetical protein EDF70_11085 [Neorhizobium sp. JUb45]|nr:hypothetical protein EDF70_11085 [Neorhizobium sp. JUb45]